MIMKGLYWDKMNKTNFKFNDIVTFISDHGNTFEHLACNDLRIDLILNFDVCLGENSEWFRFGINYKAFCY